MSLYSFLNKDTLVYDKLNHFINDPRFIALMEAYKQSDAYVAQISNQQITQKILIQWE